MLIESDEPPAFLEFYGKSIFHGICLVISELAILTNKEKFLKVRKLILTDLGNDAKDIVQN